MGPGSTFTVEFANDSVPPTNMAPGTFVPTVIAEPEVDYNGAASEQAPPVAQPISSMAYAPK